MQLTIDNSNYDNFLKTRFISGNFLQSSLWRDFLVSQKKDCWQVVVRDGEKIIATTLFYENKLPLGKTYLSAPKGPIFATGLNAKQITEAMALILSQARDVSISTSKKAEIFFQIEPSDYLKNNTVLKKIPDNEPANTWVLDISKDVKELLANMHPKTRYNISLAKRKGVEIVFSQQPEDIEHFLSLSRKTGDKKQILIHSNAYYRTLWQSLLSKKAAYICFAKLGDQFIAANLVVKFGQAMTYLYGASDYHFRSSMAPHLLQWETIKKAQAEGLLIYDFWGIAPPDGSRPGWEGFSRFKKSFGGYQVDNPGTYILIYDNTWYRFYKLAQQTRRLLRKVNHV